MAPKGPHWPVECHWTLKDHIQDGGLSSLVSSFHEAQTVSTRRPPGGQPVHPTGSGLRSPPLLPSQAAMLCCLGPLLPCFCGFTLWHWWKVGASRHYRLPRPNSQNRFQVGPGWSLGPELHR